VEICSKSFKNSLQNVINKQQQKYHNINNNTKHIYRKGKRINNEYIIVLKGI